jgi:tetratricopeptide (TPR) repeat protein
VLHDELGLDPSPELQNLHRQILAGGMPAAEEEPGRAPVRCLPRTVGDFTGREAVVRRLLGAIDGADPNAPVIAVVDGMAGSGKTTLALHVAALVGDRYPDAHLYVDLHGHSTEQPLEPSAALLILLRQLGVAADRIPPSLVERVSLWRTELAGRRPLVLFDNVASSAQLADLLPTAPGSLALVTGRRRLTGLDGVHPESLAVLTGPEAVALLARIAGDRVLAEPEAAAEVARRCGGLPLALRLAGSRLAHRPRWRVADLVRRLGASPLPELAAEDRSVADAFALSFTHLSKPAMRLFRLLGLYPGTSFDLLDTAALSGLSLDDARDALDDLVDVHLADEPARDQYRLHDLLREFAAALAAELPPEDRREALVGVLDLQLHAAAAVAPEHHRRMAYRDLGNPRPLRPELLAEIGDPEERFERERPHLAAFVEAAAASGRPEYAWWIPRAAWWRLFYQGSSQEMIVLFQRALAIVEDIGDRGGIATMANYLGSFHLRTGDPRRAGELLELCIRLRGELGMRSALVSPLCNLAAVRDRLGRFAPAIEAARQARRLGALTGDTIRGQYALQYLSSGAMRLGRYADALRTYRIYYLYSLESGDEQAAVTALLGIARTRRLQGSMTVAAARRYLELMLRSTLRHRLQPLEAEVRSDLARLLREEGRYREAISGHREAVAIALRIGEIGCEAEFLNEFAYTCRAAGDPVQARELHERVVDLARRTGLAYDGACAEAGIAECVVDTDPDSARQHWTTALAAFREMGVPEQFEVERRLAEVIGDPLRPGRPGETMVS